MQAENGFYMRSHACRPGDVGKNRPPVIPGNNRGGHLFRKGSSRPVDVGKASAKGEDSGDPSHVRPRIRQIRAGRTSRRPVPRQNAPRRLSNMEGFLHSKETCCKGDDSGGA